MVELLAKQIDSKVIAFKGVSDYEYVEVLPSYQKRIFLQKLRNIISTSDVQLNYLERKAFEAKTDIIHIQHSFLFGKITSLLEFPKLSRPKVVITLRGGDTYIKPWVSKRWKDFYLNYANKVDAFVVMSEDQKQYLGRWNVPLDRIYVIPISFGLPFKILPKYPNKDKMRVVSVFRMCWEKSISDNLRFIKKIKESGVDISYDVYGDGKDLGQLYFLLDRFGLNDCVQVKGRVENSIIRSRFKNYDFILQLSHSESFGMSIVEAQACGVPAVVSNVGGLPEIVKKNKTGLIGNSDDLETLSKNTVNLWRDKNQYLTFSEFSITNAQKKFNLEVEVKSLISLYKNLLRN